MNKLRKLESRNQAINLFVAGLTGPALFLVLNQVHEFTNYAYLGQDQWELLYLTSVFNLIFFASRKYSSVFLLMSGLEHYTKVIRDVLIISALLTLAIFILNLSAGRSFLTITASFLLVYWLPYRKVLSVVVKRGLRKAEVLVISSTNFINEYFVGLFGQIDIARTPENPDVNADLVLFHNLSAFDTKHELIVAKLESAGKIVGYVSNELKLEGWSGVQVVMGPHLMRIRPFLSLSFIQSVIKRSSDLILAIIVLVLLLPFFPMLYFWYIAKNGRPFFFHQSRVGQAGKEFKILKIRTMNSAPIQINDSVSETTNWRPKPKNQDLVLGGSSLRRWSIDELPQFFNVIKGEMSIIGPRPRLPEEINETYQLTSPVYQAKLKPGMTGLWQISGRSLNSIEYSSVLDKYYLDHWSPVMDLQILIKTIAALKLGVGAN